MPCPRVCPRFLSRRDFFPTLAAGAAIGVTFFFGPDGRGADQGQAGGGEISGPTQKRTELRAMQLLPPKACQLVDGDISPNGWCSFWAKKPG